MDEVVMQLIVQKKTNGVTDRVWKLTSKKNLHVAGSSKKADIYFPNVTSPVWIGFEYRDDQWHILNLSGESSHDFVEKKIESPIELKCPDFSLEIFPVNIEFKLTEDSNFNYDADHEIGVLILQSSHGRVTKSYVLNLSEFPSRFQVPAPKAQWQKFNDNATGEIFFYKSTPLHNDLIPKLTKEPKEKDPAYRYLHAISLFTLFMGLSFYLLLPSEKGASEVALSSVPPKAMMREIKSEPKKRPKVQESKGGQAPSVIEATPTKNTVSGESAFGNTSRLAQMIARISNRNVVSKNVVIVKNAKMGDASGAISAASISDQIGGTTKGLGQVGGATSGVTVGTLSNQTGNGTGSGRGLASVANGLTGSGGSAAASALDEEADVEGGLDPELIANFIKSRLGEILYCYERQLSANPNLYGKVGVKFIIGGSGAVESSRVFQSSLQNPTVEGCIIQKIGKWKFPQPKGGTQVVVTYPFLFKNTN
jgi:hypothetical protein